MSRFRWLVNPVSGAVNRLRSASGEPLFPPPGSFGPFRPPSPQLSGPPPSSRLPEGFAPIDPPKPLPLPARPTEIAPSLPEPLLRYTPDGPRAVKIPQVTDRIDPSTGRPMVEMVDHTINPIPASAFDDFDNLFRTDRQGSILELFAEIENVESIDRLYLVTEILRRYRPQMPARQGRVLSEALEDAAQRLNIPSEWGGMRLFDYLMPTADAAPAVSRTFMTPKAMLDEVNSLGKKVKNKTSDPFEIVADLNRYDQGPEGGIIGRAIARNELGDANDQRLIKGQVEYWRRQALNKLGLEPEDFQGLRGLRYTDDMSEADRFNRTVAAMRSATSEDEVAMILVQSRGRVTSPNYTDVLDDLSGKMTLDIAGATRIPAGASGYGKPVPGSSYYIGRIEAATDVDDFFVQPPFIGPLMQSPLGARTAQGMLRNMGLPELPESVLRGPVRRPEGSIRGVNIESIGPTFEEFKGLNPISRFGALSPIDRFGSSVFGRVGYGPVIRGLEDPLAPVSAARRLKEGAPSPLIKRSFVEKGTDLQQRWAKKFAEGRIDQLLSDNPVVRREAAAVMRDAINRGWVEPSLAEEMRRIVRQAFRRQSR